MKEYWSRVTPNVPPKTWLGKINYYCLQWLGFRLARVVDAETNCQVGWRFVKMAPGAGWIKRGELD